MDLVPTTILFRGARRLQRDSTPGPSHKSRYKTSDAISNSPQQAEPGGVMAPGRGQEHSRKMLRISDSRLSVRGAHKTTTRHFAAFRASPARCSALRNTRAVSRCPLRDERAAPTSSAKARICP
eukprot:4914283-Pyramimonas_sp.AAC.1